MKVVLSICMIVAATFVWAAEKPPPSRLQLPSSRARSSRSRTSRVILTSASRPRTARPGLRSARHRSGKALKSRWKNWIHLRDGSGSAADNTNDVLVTTTNSAKAGDVVTVKGVVRTNKDFGSGYSYKVLIEEATLQQ
jgi:hypothetical protein